MKRVNIDGPGDDPDEYWFECEHCEGEGQVLVTDFEADEDGRVSVLATCADCAGLGVIEGDADDVAD
jgi:DnaJ-class molecular chaperone